MFGIGIPELVIILIVALLVVGPSKLPELARSMGKALGEFRRLADDVKETIEQEMAKEPEKDDEVHNQAQKEEEIKEQPQEVQAPHEQGQEQILLADGHIVAEQAESQPHADEQKEDIGQNHPQNAPEERQAAGEQKKDLAEKIAEGIRVNEPPKT